MTDYPQSVMIDWPSKVGIKSRHGCSRRKSRQNKPCRCCGAAGGTDKAYWHMTVPGLPGYSFVEHFASRGALVIAVDDPSNTHLPGVTGSLSILQFIVDDHAGRARCPVFIGLGERDFTPSHHEAKAYRSSTDITLFILDGSAHCHNSANTRHLLWDRPGGWIRSVPFAAQSASKARGEART
jgi:pimeloyl-ACP methyl ester carboxylesterase